jgi:two-component system, OmpR family, response regulator
MAAGSDPTSQPTVPSPVPPKPTVLVVEDDPATYGALRAILSHRGWHVAVAVTLAEAMRQLDVSPPDCVILDLMLPDGNGVALLRAIRQRKLPVKVVVTTGAGDPNILQQTTGLAPDVLLRKPINLQELLRAIR